MISSVPIHHNSFANELMWRTHFPVKQESLDDSTSNISPEIYADTEIDTDHDLDQQRNRSDHLARFMPPTISTSPTIPTHQGIYLSPTYQQRDLKTHFKVSPSRISPYPMRSSPTTGHHKTSPTSILSSPSPSNLYHQKISPLGCDLYQSSTPDKFRASPSRHSDLYRTSPNISIEFPRISPNSHVSGVSTNFSSDPFQSPQSYSHLHPPIGIGQSANDIYRSLNFNNLPKIHSQLSPHLTPVTDDEPLNMNSKQIDLSPRHQRLSPYPNLNRHPASHDQQQDSPVNVSSENPCSPPSVSNHGSHDSIDDSRSPSPLRSKKKSSDSLWNGPGSEAPPAEYNDVPSLKCYFCSYNTKSRIQLNKHMRDAHNESKIMAYQHNKESTNESEDDNENETHSNLSEDFMMDEYDEEDAESEDFVNINKVSQSANSNKRTSYKCKKCVLTFKDKDEYYVHQKDNHIKREKLLECKLCPFVTEYKHHHEYHIKNHFKMKPFKCSYSNCKYSCNNQSMLNSHVKSHKSFYQFHCKNCNYATKYMHSFKLHLRKNNHEKGITLNEDGSVNNDIIIDIHGTRRGPKRKSRKLDDIALRNINNNNCITETIKKTIHHEPESEYNNNITMSSNNGSSRSNSPLSNINYNNNNNDSYYLNTKLFVYSHMASMMGEKAPEIWAKDTSTMVENLKHFGNVPEVMDLSESAVNGKEIQIDAEAPLDLSKTVETKAQHTDFTHKTQTITNEVILQNPEANQQISDFLQKQAISTNPSLIKIENKVKTSADMIRVVGKNNFHVSNGTMFKNKNRIKLCKNNEKSIKTAFEKGLKEESDKQRINNNEVAKENNHDTPGKIVAEISESHSNSKLEEARSNNPAKCDENEKTNNNEVKNDVISINTSPDDVICPNKINPKEDFIAISEASKNAISSNKNRRRKGKAYKLQVNNDHVDNVTDDFNIEVEDREEETTKSIGTAKDESDVKSMSEEFIQKEPKSTYEAMQMDYLKQIQNQYLKTFQQSKCLENCGVPFLPPSSQHNAISHLNNMNSSHLFDSKSQILSNFQQNSRNDFVGSHLKNLERINSHLLQSSLNTSRHKSEGLKSIDNILNKKTETTNNVLSSFLNKRNEIGQNMNNNRLWYKCELCDIQYLDELIYSIHMRYHNIEHPYKCNLCGLQTSNKLQFNLHIIQTPH